MNQWIWVLAAIVVAFMLFRPAAPASATLSPGEARDWIAAEKDLQLVDVRSPDEFKSGHLAGAKLIPLYELAQRLKELDAKKPLLFYCASGNRSGQALKLVAEQGFSGAKHLGGGIGAWSGAGLPVTR